MIIVGALAVINTLFPIYLYQNSRNWQAVEGNVVSSKVLGMLMHFRRGITFTYMADSVRITNMQIIAREPWVDDLKEGSKIPIRYKSGKPKLAIIDHEQVWPNILLSLWNAVWIVVGVVLIKRK